MVSRYRKFWQGREWVTCPQQRPTRQTETKSENQYGAHRSMSPASIVRAKSPPPRRRHLGDPGPCAFLLGPMELLGLSKPCPRPLMFVHGSPADPSRRPSLQNVKVWNQPCGGEAKSLLERKKGKGALQEETGCSRKQESQPRESKFILLTNSLN